MQNIIKQKHAFGDQEYDYLVPLIFRRSDSNDEDSYNFHFNLDEIKPSRFRTKALFLRDNPPVWEYYSPFVFTAFTVVLQRTMRR